MFGIINVNKRSGDESMEKFAIEKSTIMSYFKENYSNYIKGTPFTLQKQLPVMQLRHFIRQAVRKQNSITIQLNPTFQQATVSECTGIANFSPYSSQIILTSQDNKTIHLINIEQIRHIRLNSSLK